MLMLRRRLRSGAPWKSSLLLALLVATVALRTALASAADRSGSSPPTTSNEAAESGGGGEEVASELIYEALRALPNPVESLPTAQERLDMDPEEFEALMRKIWKRRQQEIAEAMEAAETDAKTMRQLLDT